MRHGTSSQQQEQAADQAAHDRAHAGALDRVLSHLATCTDITRPAEGMYP
jgi:hypothetical protein